MTTLPTHLDETLQLSATDFSKLKSFREGRNTKGSIKWNSGINSKDSVGFELCFTSNPTIHLSYVVNGQKINSSIRLTSRKSNLGLGLIWFFICPISGLTSRKLYFHDLLFINRKAATNAAYSYQCLSHCSRSINNCFKIDSELDRLYELLYSGKIRTTYSNRQTNTHKKLIARIKTLERKSRHQLYDNF